MARTEEFNAVVAWAGIQTGNTVLDVPSGGEYLAPYLPDVQLIAVDPSEHFASFSENSASSSTVVCALNQLSLAQNCIDVAISLVGLHHESNRAQILRDLSRVIKPEGKLIIAEVESLSPAALFLNEFVDQYNPLGHQGNFVDQAFMQEISDAGWNVRRNELTTSRWHFSDIQSMTRYFRLMFYLQSATDEEIIAGIDHYLGFICSKEGVSIAWPLRQLMLLHD